MINKYRPESWDDVMGNPVAVSSLRASVQARSSSAYLLTGDSGLGKTTLARLIASTLGYQYDERDAATRTGVDDIRKIIDGVVFKPLDAPGRVICLDEAHMLTKNAWNAALKAIEEPPSHIVWVLCTTELSKVPKSIQTRCHSVQLARTSDRELTDFLHFLADEELDGERLPSLVIEALLDNADGSPRQLLSDFERIVGLDKKDQLQVLSTSTLETKEVFDLVRALGQSGGSWAQLMGLLKKIESVNPTAVRAVALAYYSKVAMSKWSPVSLTILEAFREPFTENKTHELLGALGEVVNGRT